KNEIREIPRKISSLNNLKTLIFSDNNFKEFPKAVTLLGDLQTLRFASSPMKSIPKEIANLQNLTLIELCNCKISTFPTEILKLKNLTYLNLGNYTNYNSEYKNSISILPPEITRLQKLETLFLRDNQIKELPKEICRLKALKRIVLEGNPIESPPPEIAIAKDYKEKDTGKNLERIRNYFKELEKEEEDYLYEVKLLLVGEERAGKSSLAEALSNPEYTFKDKQSTEGIDIFKWMIPKEEVQLPKELRLNIWDFGGQEIYHATHQFFLTRRSLYFLVTEARKDMRHDDFYYWLNCIGRLGEKSPVMILLNKCDQPNTGLSTREYQETFPNIVDSLKVSCKNEYRATIHSLKAAVLRVVKNKELLPDIGTPLPKVWVDIRNELETLKEEGKDYISGEEYFALCGKYGMNEERALFLSDFFHRLGVFLHFRNNIFLDKTIFLNHEWVTRGVYNVLDNQEIIDRHGRFNEDDLKKIWGDEKYKDKRGVLLLLMKNFELCFELEKGEYLAPQLLPTDKPTELHGFEDPSSLEDPLRFEYRYTFMPKGILARFIVKRSRDIYKNTYWRYGVLLEYANTKALIRERYSKIPKRIIITLQGDNKKVLLSLIRKTIAEIHGDFHDLEFQEMIPCNCPKCKKNTGPCYHDLAELEERIRRNQPTIECRKSYVNIDVAALIEEVIISRAGMERAGMEKAGMARTGKRHKIFISYSHKDKEWLERVLTHLKALPDEAIETDTWADTRIKAGMKWQEEISKALEAARVAVLLISPDFLASDFIKKVELPALLQAAETDGTAILPVILSPSRFSSHKALSQFQSINDPVQPLVDLSKGEQDRILVKLTGTIEDYLLNEPRYI
ncbi:MAG: TIR domain-containing protein, partial [Candidatus Aminicenantes bacterium]|nr:TIR domain-containing protein [Candidatus Aminicenantes bacterium]